MEKMNGTIAPRKKSFLARVHFECAIGGLCFEIVCTEVRVARVDVVYWDANMSSLKWIRIGSDLRKCACCLAIGCEADAAYKLEENHT
jgi:hypothetical protein